MNRDEERERRIGLNEAVFRELNDRLEELEETFRPGRDELDLVCECGDANCSERLRVPRADYRRLRLDSRLFAVVPGHDEPDVEEVVEHHTSYEVVQKHGGVPARIAVETDPRSG
jgi:hypothetical protein